MPLTYYQFCATQQPYKLFLQTADMLTLYKRNEQAGALITFHKQSYYGCHLLYLSGVDVEIGNVVTFAIGLISSCD